MLLPLCQSISSRSSLDWDFTQHRVVIPYRRFGTAYRSYLKGSRSYWTSWPLKELTVAIRGTVTEGLPSAYSAETKCFRRVVSRCVTMLDNNEKGRTSNFRENRSSSHVVINVSFLVGTVGTRSWVGVYLNVNILPLQVQIS